MRHVCLVSVPPVSMCHCRIDESDGFAFGTGGTVGHSLNSFDFPPIWKRLFLDLSWALSASSFFLLTRSGCLTYLDARKVTSHAAERCHVETVGSSRITIGNILASGVYDQDRKRDSFDPEWSPSDQSLVQRFFNFPITINFTYL
jgi:hypothetical protein